MHLPKPGASHQRDKAWGPCISSLVTSFLTTQASSYLQVTIIMALDSNQCFRWMYIYPILYLKKTLNPYTSRPYSFTFLLILNSYFLRPFLGIGSGEFWLTSDFNFKSVLLSWTLKLSLALTTFSYLQTGVLEAQCYVITKILILLLGKVFFLSACMEEAPLSVDYVSIHNSMYSWGSWLHNRSCFCCLE